MIKYSSHLSKTLFRAIYVEKNAKDYEITDDILRKHAGIPVIFIRSYKDILNRPGQNPARQRQYPALILAVKEPPYIYEGPPVCQSFGTDAFFYASFLLNCPFDCQYCFLQGMYPSPYCTAFVNIPDYADAITAEAKKHSSMLLALSYDTDLIAFDSVYSYTGALSFLTNVPGLITEIRTKSASCSLYKSLPPSEKRIFAFSLSPQEMIDRYERKTPALEARLRAARTAIDFGHPVRLCFDPVFIGDFPKDCYDTFFKKVFSELPAERILDVSHGFFRMNRTFFRRIAKIRPDSLLFASDYALENDIVSYRISDMQQIQNAHISTLTQYIPKEKIYAL